MLQLYHYVWSRAQSVWEIEGLTRPGAAEWREEKPCCQRDEEEARTCCIARDAEHVHRGMLGEGGLYRVRGPVSQEKLRSSWQKQSLLMIITATN